MTTATQVIFSPEAQQTVRMFLDKTLPVPSAQDFLRALSARRTSRAFADHSLVMEGWTRAGGSSTALMALARDTRVRAKGNPQDTEAQEISKLLDNYREATVGGREKSQVIAAAAHAFIETILDEASTKTE